MKAAIALSVLLVPAPVAQAPTLFSPAAAQAGLGNSGNNFPFAILPFHYQQVHDLATFSSTQPALLTGLGFRMAAGNTNTPGHGVDVELFLAQCPNDAAHLSLVFQRNVTPGTEVNVFQRRTVQLPRIPDHGWRLDFPFDTPFAFPGNAHLSWRAVVRAISDPRANYVLDAWSGAGSARDGGFAGCAAQNGIVPSRHLAFNQAPGGVNLYSSWSGIPYVATPALLALSTATVQWQGMPLPIDLGPFGAPGCVLSHGILLAVPAVTRPDDLGDIDLLLPVPFDPGLVGASYTSQFLFFHPGSNALGMHTSGTEQNTLGSLIGISRVYAPNDPNAASGMVGVQFGLAIGLR